MNIKSKYLRSGINIDEFIGDVIKLINKWEVAKDEYVNSRAMITEWVKEPMPPKLSHEEEIILTSIKDKQKIIFSDGFNLWTRDDQGEDNFLGQFNHLFQFIGRNEQYSIEELIGDEKNI